MTNDNTAELIAAISARVEAATVGPWRTRRAGWESSGTYKSDDWEHPEIWGIAAGEQTTHQNQGDFHPDEATYTLDEIAVVAISHDRDYDYAEGAIQIEGDADFIAHSREDIPFLLATVSALTTQLAEAKAEQREVDAGIAQGRHRSPVGADTSGNVYYQATARFPDDGRRIAAAIRAEGSGVEG